jgi:hypothetical protein
MAGGVSPCLHRRSLTPWWGEGWCWAGRSLSIIPWPHRGGLGRGEGGVQDASVHHECWLGTGSAHIPYAPQAGFCPSTVCSTRRVLSMNSMPYHTNRVLFL